MPTTTGDNIGVLLTTLNARLGERGCDTLSVVPQVEIDPRGVLEPQEHFDLSGLEGIALGYLGRERDHIVARIGYDPGRIQETRFFNANVYASDVETTETVLLKYWNYILQEVEKRPKLVRYSEMEELLNTIRDVVKLLGEEGVNVPRVFHSVPLYFSFPHQNYLSPINLISNEEGGLEQIALTHLHTTREKMLMLTHFPSDMGGRSLDVSRMVAAGISREACLNKFWETVKYCIIGKRMEISTEYRDEVFAEVFGHMCSLLRVFGFDVLYGERPRMRDPDYELCALRLLGETVTYPRMDYAETDEWYYAMQVKYIDILRNKLAKNLTVEYFDVEPSVFGQTLDKADIIMVGLHRQDGRMWVAPEGVYVNEMLGSIRLEPLTTVSEFEEVIFQTCEFTRASFARKYGVFIDGAYNLVIRAPSAFHRAVPNLIRALGCYWKMLVVELERVRDIVQPAETVQPVVSNHKNASSVGRIANAIGEE